MFERFTDQARRVVVLAQDEARRFGQRQISTEDFLLSVVHESDSGAAATLESLGIDLETVRRRAEEAIDRGEGEVFGHIPFTQQAKDVLARAMREADTLGHRYIDTEHLLLGLIDDANSGAAKVLTGLGVTLKGTRAQVRKLHGE
jgi:ATP-dependent Clp protease ATP-binding subunit ClpC